MDAILSAHYAALRTQSPKSFFKNDPHRFERFSANVAGLLIDYSKHWITDETLALLCAHAVEKNLPQAIQALFSSEKVNISEDRAAMHTALRLLEPSQAVQDVLQTMGAIAEALKEKRLLGHTGKPIDTIIHVGVGGSGLGPQLYYQTMLTDERHATCHFLTHFDFDLVQSTLAACHPETTLAIIVSKSFTTAETMTMFDSIRSWFGEPHIVQQHCYAVTAKIERAMSQGFLETHILPFWDFVGGRYSIWSAVNFANVLVFGLAHFERFLQGGYAMDQHFQTMPFEKNMPVVLALIAFWYNNFFHAYSRAVVPYCAAFTALPLYLQQLFMESLGKSVTKEGHPVDYPTGQVLWGDVGPSGQHSFHQLLMQGTQLLPVDFILPFYRETLNDYDKKRAAYCLSQSETLLNGCDGNAYEKIPGDRPSTTIVIRHFSPETLGALLALYEHQVYVKSVLWDINPFDQWGVERGKKIAELLLQDNATVDPVSRGLYQKVF